MGLKETTKAMHTLITKIAHDLTKAEKGNRAASQRVRTGTIKLEKIAKRYRKESVSGQKAGSLKKGKKKVTRKKKATKRKTRRH